MYTEKSFCEIFISVVGIFRKFVQLTKKYNNGN